MKVRAQCSAVHGSIFRQPVTLIVQCTHVRGIREHYVFNDRMRFNAHVFTRDAYRCMVHGAWCMVHGAWCMVHGALCMVHGAWCMVHGACKDLLTLACARIQMGRLLEREATCSHGTTV